MQKTYHFFIWVIKPIFSAIIAKASLSLFNLLGWYPDIWLAKKVASIIDKPYSELQNIAFWLLFAIITIFIFFSISRNRANRKLDKAILFFAPKNEYELIWDPPHDLQIITKPILKSNEESLDYRLPIFRLKNLGKEVVRDIAIEWEVPKDFINQKIMKSESFKDYDVNFTNNIFEIKYNKKDGPIASGYRIDFNEKNSYEYLSPQLDNDSYLNVQIPCGIYHVLETVFVGEMPESTIGTVVKKNIFAKVSYRQGNQSFTDKYKIISKAISFKPWSTGEVKIPINGKMRTPPRKMMNIKFIVENIG